MREEEKKISSRGTKLKRFFKKRWVYPAIYIASAALILTAVLWFQNNSNDNAIDSDEFKYNASEPGKEFKNPAVEVTSSKENIMLPLAKEDRSNVTIKTKFYEDSAKPEEQEAALVVYKNQYHPNTGIDLTVKDDEAFDVVASLSGTVTKVQNDALLGNVIEIEHDDSIVTRYSSVTDVQVEIGDKVKQGQALATAGKSMFNEEAGVHVHFEIRKDGVPVNPENYLNKPLSELQKANVEKEETPKSETEKGVTDDEKAAEDKENSAPTDQQGSTTDEKEKSTSDEEKSSMEDEKSKEQPSTNEGSDKENTDPKQENTKKNKDA